MKTRLVIAIGSFALSIFLTLGICKADVYSDDFSVDSRGAYTVVNTWTQSGVGNFLYDAAGDRLQVKTGDNVGLAFSKELVEASASGVFRLDFFPNKKYPSGGILKLRLEQDADNYYEVENTDGYGPGKVRKIVGGQVVEEIGFNSGYLQNVVYRPSVTFVPGLVRVEGFGSEVLLQQNSTPLTVGLFVVEISQQDAYIDNLYFSSAVVNQAPSAVAGADQTVKEAAVVALDGSGSSDADGMIVSYLWEQTAGPGVTLSGSGAQRSFSAPGVGMTAEALTFRLTVTDDGGLTSSDTVTVTVQPAESFSYSDDFSVDSRGAYTVVNTWTQSGVGNFLYDAAGDRLQVKTGDNVGLAFSKELVEASASGVFRLDFFPNKKYPSGGILKLRLEQDADNYYEVENTDGYGPGKVRKIVGGQVVEEMAFPTEYRQGNAYRIEVYYSNGSVRVDAFGSGLALDQSIASILVSRMVVEISQQDAYFDNIYYTLGPFLKILAPIDYFIQEDSNLNAIAITSDIIKASGVKFTLRSADNLDIIAEYIDLVRPFEHIFPNLKKGEYQIDAIFIDSNGYELHGNFASDTAVQVGIGDVYVAIGDSITYGIGDDISTDNTSHDWRNISGGYSPILNNKLTTLKGYPHTILNEGVPGDTSSGGLTRIQEVIDRNPISKYFLILYGTNDSHSHNNSVPVRSGLDTNGKLMLESNPNYPGTFLHNMQTIIDKLKSSQKIPVLSKVPITLGPCSNCPSFPNPDLASRNLLIQEYNIVIDALVLINGILISPPDFYNYFRLHQNEMSDNLHPNGLGYQSMSNLWFDSITYSR